MRTIVDLENDLKDILGNDYIYRWGYTIFIKEIKDLSKAAVMPLTKKETDFIRMHYGISSVEDSKKSTLSLNYILKVIAEMVKNESSTFIDGSSINLIGYDKAAWEKLLELDKNIKEIYNYIRSVLNSGDYSEEELDCIAIENVLTVHDGIKIIRHFPIFNLELDDSIVGILRDNHIYELGQLLSISKKELKRLNGIELRDIIEIENTLYNKLGLKFIEDVLYDWVNNFPKVNSDKFLSNFSKAELLAIKRGNIFDIGTYMISDSMISERCKEEIVNSDKYKDLFSSLDGYYTYNKNATIYRFYKELLPDDVNKRLEIQDSIIWVKKMVSISLEELDFSNRAKKALKNYGINSLFDIVKLSRSELMKIENFGQKSFDEVVDKIGILGINFVDESLDSKFNVDQNLISIIDRLTNVANETCDELNLKEEVYSEMLIPKEDLHVVDLPIEVLSGLIRTQAYNAIRRGFGCRTLGDLIKLNIEDLGKGIINGKSVRNPGESLSIDIINAVHAYGLQFADEYKPSKAIKQKTLS